MIIPSTDSQNFLASLAPQIDLDDLRTQALDTFGIDPAGIYCLHTGRKVGEYDSFVLTFAIEEEESQDPESLVDALVTRCIASMRPTPMLNKPDRVTLLNLAEKHPVDILAYLWNRLYSNSYLATHRIDAIAPYLSKIKTWQLWNELALKGVSLRPWIHWLLEIDSKRNLHEVTPPTFEGLELLEILTDKNHEQMLPRFEKWVFGQIAEYDRRDREAESQARWMRGNSLSQTAFARSWLENPEVARKKTPKKLPSKAETRRKAEDAKVNKFLGLLTQVLDGTTKIQPSAPNRKVITGAMLFKKKES